MKKNLVMKKVYIKPFVKVKVLDTDLCQITVTSDPSLSQPGANADAKEVFDFFE